MAVQPGKEGDPGLVVVGGRREDVARQRKRRGHLSAILVDIAGIKRAQSGGGGRGDCGERAQQSVGMMVAVTLDEVRIIEVVAGVEPHLCRQGGTQLLLMISRE